MLLTTKVNIFILLLIFVIDILEFIIAWFYSPILQQLRRDRGLNI